MRFVHLDLCDWPGRRESAEQSNGGGCVLPFGRGHGWRVGTGHRRLRGDHEQRHERLFRIPCCASFGSRLKRNWAAASGTIIAFGVILWLHGGNTAARFQSVLLFSAYWIAPFLAIVLIDWLDRKATVTHEGLCSLMDLKNLNVGWTALVSLVVGFGAMVPFMNTGLLVGPVAKRLDGADLSFWVGFVVAFCVYLALRKYEVPNAMLSRDRLETRPGHTHKPGSARAEHRS